MKLAILDDYQRAAPALSCFANARIFGYSSLTPEISPHMSAKVATSCV